MKHNCFFLEVKNRMNLLLLLHNSGSKISYRFRNLDLAVTMAKSVQTLHFWSSFQLPY